MYYIIEGYKINAPNTKFPNRSFLIKEQIGKGGEGAVYLAKPENWDKDFDVALKFQVKMNETEFDFINQLIEVQNNRDEIESKTYKPTNIIRIYDIFNYQNVVIQVMEVGEVNLFKFMKQYEQKLSYGEKIKICYELLNSISYIHFRGLIHRDIKGENFILVKKEFKLIDFGLLSIKNRLITSTRGTRIYQPPEILELEVGGEYTQAIDIWALGCVFYEIFAEQELFPCSRLATSLEQIKGHKKNQNHVHSLIDELKVSQEWKELIKNMLHPNYILRLTIKESMTKVKSILSLNSDQNINKSISVQKQKEKIYQQNSIDFDNESQNDKYQQEFNKIYQEKIQQFESQIKSKELDIQNYKDQITKLETENKNLKFQFEQSSIKIKQQADQIQNLVFNSNQSNQQVQAYINQQANYLANSYIQSMNQSKLNQENETINLKKKVQELEDEKLKLQNKLNQSRNFETSKASQEVYQLQQNTQNIEQNCTQQSFEQNTLEQIKFLVKIIGDSSNEIQNLEQSLQSFQCVQKILKSNNEQLNTQIKDLEKLIQDKKSSIQNYQKIKLEIQQLGQQNQQISQQQQPFDLDQQQNKVQNKLKTPQEEQQYVSQAQQNIQFAQIQQQSYTLQQAQMQNMRQQFQVPNQILQQQIFCQSRNMYQPSVNQ